ncbi:Hypothetical predicted protein [Paramuricea clavata]|uniref:Uncharacterized protein n=1 Tax=Paramuricea clavata TaxID=317549 RepID=A0A7D9HD99_PARCT|nr:Hypothetical predicted protein [Paramuricea clavata]
MLKSESCGKLWLPRLTACGMKNAHQKKFAKIAKHGPNCYKTNSGILQYQRKTGEDPAAKPLTTTMVKIISLLSDEPSFSGIQGGFVSGVPSDSGKFIVTFICVLSNEIK